MHGIVRVASLLVVLALGACGGGQSACEAAGLDLCDRACSCATDGKCRIVSGGASITFDTQTDCEALYVTLGCSGGGDASVDFDACQGDLAVAACVDGAEAGEVGVEMPASCNSN